MVFLCLHVPVAFLKHIVLSNGLGIVSQVQRGGQTKLKEVAAVLHRETWSTAFPASLAQNSCPPLSRTAGCQLGGYHPALRKKPSAVTPADVMAKNPQHSQRPAAI